MIIQSLKIKNLQLIKSVETTFDKINVVSGLNKDNPTESGNGSGKSTLVLRAILFGIYGYVEEGLKLVDLIRFGEKETSVEIEIEKDNNLFKIIRKIPSDLQIFLNGKEIQANTQTIKQQFINEHFGDVNFFRQYRCVDLKNGINLLDMGIVSVRKTLMGFIEGIFSEIRTKLLAKKVERERYSIDKKLYKHYLSQKRLDILNASITATNNQITESRNLIRECQSSISKVNGEISAKKRIIDYKLTETQKAEEGLCPILKKTCDRIGKKITEEDKRKMSAEVDKLRQEIKDLEESIIGDNDYLADLEMQLQSIEERKQKTNEKLLRLKGAFQFADYKYTKADIVIYDESIRVLDNFAGEYIKEWLSSLSIIINNLLRPINLSVEFRADKDFLKVKDNEQILKYDQLSTGQKCFLSVIFKLAILMQQNKTGMILMDDGLNNLDAINLKNLITICQTLPFQIIAVYQSKVEIEGIKQFTVVREKGESKIQ